MIGALSIDAYLPALPFIAKGFGVSAALAQQTLTAYLFAYSFMTLFYGTLSDSFGRKPVILASLAVYLAGSIGCAASDSVGWLMTFRVLQGLSAGAGSVVGRAIVGDLLSGAEAQRAMAYISMIFSLAPAIAPILGGWLQAEFGWRAIFLSIAAFTLALFVVCQQGLVESLPAEKRHPFHFKVVVANYIEVGAHSDFMLMSLANALAFFGILLYVGAAPAFVMTILHLSVKEFGWLFLPIMGGFIAGSTLSGKLSHKCAPQTLIRAGFTIMAVSAVVNVAYAKMFVAAVPWAVLPLGFYGLGISLATPAMTVLSLSLFPRVRGLAASLQGFTFMIVFAIGSGVICPLVFDSAYHLSLALMGGMVLSAICWWLGTRSTVVAVPSPVEFSLSGQD